MDEFISINLIKNEYVNLNVRSLFVIVFIILLLIAFIYAIRKVRDSLYIKSPNWEQLTKNSAYISSFVVFIIALISIFETIGIDMSKYMAWPMVKTEKILITPYRIIFIAILYLITWAVNMTLKSIFANQVKQNQSPNFANLNIFKLVKYILWVTAIAISMQTIGLNLTFVLAGSAALLVGVGIGMQNIFNDMISGFFLLFERNLKINDVVEVDGIVGKVKDIGMRTSRILTRDNIEMVVPNSKFISEKVINWSYNDRKTRFFLSVGVAYESDIKLVKKVLEEVATDHKLVLRKPMPFVFFREFADSSLSFELAFWTIHSLDNEIIKSDLRFAINQKFKENKIQIPFPQRDVHMIGTK